MLINDALNTNLRRTLPEGSNGAVDREFKNVKNSNAANVQLEESSINEEKVIKAIEQANKALENSYTRFEFSIHEVTREIMVKVFDQESGELIREIPPEKILDLVAKMWELAGIIVDEKV